MSVDVEYEVWVNVSNLSPTACFAGVTAPLRETAGGRKETEREVKERKLTQWSSVGG